MKIRSGWVANSSSSSFIIVSEELTREQLVGHLKLPTEGTFSWLMDGMIKEFLTAEPITMSELESDRCWDGHDLDDVLKGFKIPKEIREKLKSGELRFYVYTASNESDNSLSSLLYENSNREEFHIKGDDFVLYSEH